jgi:thiol:disulfide interchange protein DsbC
MMMLAGVTLLSPGAQAQEDPTTALTTTLQQRFPEIKIDAVAPAPIPGLYEVFAGERVVYADKTGDYLILGRLVDTRSRHDLTEEHLEARRSIDFDKLPFGKAVKIVKGNGSRQIALFEDPDCPYCQQLEQALRPLTDLTAYVFLYPLENLHPDATAHARAIWCSPDRSVAWTAWMTERKPPAALACTGDPLAEIRTLAESLHVASTPTLFLADGRRVGGALSTAELQALLGPVPTAGMAPTAER